MSPLYLYNGALLRVGSELAAAQACCCSGTCCQYGPIFPINFHAVGTSIEGNPFDVSDTALGVSWSGLGNILLLGPCTAIPEENVYGSVVPGFIVTFRPSGSAYDLFGGIPTEFIETWPCDEIEDIAGSSAYLLGAFNANVGSVTFS